MASDLKGVVREEKRQYLVRRKRPKAKGRNCSLSGRKRLPNFSKKQDYVVTLIWYSEQVLLEIVPSLWDVCINLTATILLWIPKSQINLCSLFIWWFSFIHSSPSRGFSLKPRQTIEAQPWEHFLHNGSGRKNSLEEKARHSENTI